MQRGLLRSFRAIRRARMSREAGVLCEARQISIASRREDTRSAWARSRGWIQRGMRQDLGFRNRNGQATSGEAEEISRLLERSRTWRRRRAAQDLARNKADFFDERTITLSRHRSPSVDQRCLPPAVCQQGRFQKLKPIFEESVTEAKDILTTRPAMPTFWTRNKARHSGLSQAVGKIEHYRLRGKQSSGRFWAKTRRRCAFEVVPL